jgi:putative hydrolase
LKLVVDTHTHSLSSGHAYSTIQEMALEAKTNGIKMFAVTDHAPAMEGAPTWLYFWNLKAVPEEMHGVKIVKGVEANIVDFNGKLDLSDIVLANLDFVIASLHDVIIEPSTVEDNTAAFVKALENPFVDAIGHPGNPKFQVNIDEVVRAAKEFNKLIEINNHSFYVRSGCEENCHEFARKCKEKGVRIVCGSDAHVSFGIGKFENVYNLLDEVGMPEELVLNTSLEKFEEYLQQKKSRIEGMQRKI